MSVLMGDNLENHIPEKITKKDKVYLNLLGHWHEVKIIGQMSWTY